MGRPRQSFWPTPLFERPTLMKPIVITDAGHEENLVTFSLPGGDVSIIRMDYIDEDTFDAMTAELEALDVEQQFVGVANDLANAKPGEKLAWQPLLDGTKARLIEMGAEVNRVVADGERRDEVSTVDVDVFKPYRERKPLPMRKRGREIALVMLKHVVSYDDFQKIESLRVGQLDRILSEWRKHSTATLGE